MKKIISLIISLTIIVSSCSLNSFATQEPPLDTQQITDIGVENESIYYLETKFLKFLGLNKLAQFLSSIANKIKETSIVEKSILLSSASSLLFYTYNLRKTIQNFYMIKYFGSNMYDYIKEKFSFFYKENEKTAEESLNVLSKELVALKGQKKAKKNINNFVASIIYEKEMAKLKNKKYNHGDVIYIFGPSGVGKSFVTERISRALSNAEPFTISASEVDPKSKTSIVNQLFKFNNYSDYYDVEHSLVQYINDTKNGVVIINEYDKIGDKNLDEALRTIIDQGTLVINGHVLDCSGITFIITSNESSSSAFGGNQDKISDVDDGTGSRTVFQHDKSFMNRVKLIEFDNLTQEDYEEIIKAEYNSEYFDYLEKLLKIKIDIGDTISHIAKKVAKVNKGARIIQDMFSKLRNELIVLKNNFNNQDDATNPKTYLVSYNENTDEFSIQLKNSQS